MDGKPTKTKAQDDAYTTTSTHPVDSDGVPLDSLPRARSNEIAPARSSSRSETGEINYKHVDGIGEQHGATKLEKDSFSFVGVVSLAVSCINSWVVLVTALSAGLTSGGPTASESDALETFALENGPEKRQKSHKSRDKPSRKGG
jgi:hypothetical protein